MTEQAVVQWVTDYGYFGIFFLLIFGIMGLPVPDEWLLVISGYLAFKNVLGLVPTLAIAVLGSAGGLTMSYVLGRTSSGYILRRYGRWLSIDDEKMRRTQHWFQNLGRWVLVIGPFVPGVRNLMGYIAGATRLRIDIFMRFAYLGAFISSVTFVTFGYFMGRHFPWDYSRIALVAVAAAVVFTASGLPFRIAFRLKKIAATTIATNPSRVIEANTQLVCEPKTSPSPIHVTDEMMAPE